MPDRFVSFWPLDGRPGIRRAQREDLQRAFLAQARRSRSGASAKIDVVSTGLHAITGAGASSRPACSVRPTITKEYQHCAVEHRLATAATSET